MAKFRTKTFVFERPEGGMKISLEGKSETMGRHEIDQWWIPLPKLKPTKAGKGGTYETICDAYPIICTDAFNREGASPEDWTGAAETHVLARLLPYARSRGALSVFNDAKESRNAHRALQFDHELEHLLTATELKPMSEPEFCEELRKMQKIRSWGDNGRRIYQGFSHDLLAGVTELWRADPEAAVQLVRERWAKLDKTIGRRAGYADQKQALDILSHECGGSFYRCYSAAWSAWILPRLHAEYALSDQSFCYLKHWHQMIVREDGGDRYGRFDTFYGHCLGLHPAGGRFMKTARGKALIGEWLDVAVRTEFRTTDEHRAWMLGLPDLPSYGRLLRGYLYAYFQYEDKYGEAKAQRKPVIVRSPPPKAIHRRNRAPGSSRNE